MSSWPTNVLLCSGETNVSGQPIFQVPVKFWAVFEESSFPCHLPPIQKVKGLLLEPVVYKNPILLYSCLVFPLSRNYWFLTIEVIGWCVSRKGSSFQGPRFAPSHLRNTFCVQSVQQHPRHLCCMHALQPSPTFQKQQKLLADFLPWLSWLWKQLAVKHLTFP